MHKLPEFYIHMFFLKSNPEIFQSKEHEPSQKQSA